MAYFWAHIPSNEYTGSLASPRLAQKLSDFMELLMKPRDQERNRFASSSSLVVRRPSKQVYKLSRMPLRTIEKTSTAPDQSSAS